MNVQRISHDSTIGEDLFHDIQQPKIVNKQRASALRFGDARVRALLSALVMFRLLPRGFTNRDLRERMAILLGKPISSSQISYDLRRLRLHGLIERVKKTHRYHVTNTGFRTALFLTRSYSRLLRPGLSAILTTTPTANAPIRKTFEAVDAAIQKAWKMQQIAA